VELNVGRVHETRAGHPIGNVSIEKDNLNVDLILAFASTWNSSRPSTLSIKIEQLSAGADYELAAFLAGEGVRGGDDCNVVTQLEQAA
jgi:hypothetical protein